MRHLAEWLSKLNVKSLEKRMNILSQEWIQTLVMSHFPWKAGYSIPTHCGSLAFMQRSESNHCQRWDLWTRGMTGHMNSVKTNASGFSLTALAICLEDVRVDTQANTPVNTEECLLPLNLTCETQGFTLLLNCLYLTGIFQHLHNPWRNVVLKYADPCSLRQSSGTVKSCWIVHCSDLFK